LSGERVERRLAAILAADVAGYSRLMGEDEAGTLARLRALRRERIDPAVAEHKGRIVKTTGDGLLIEFPSVVEAVACAIAVQRGMSEWSAGVPPALRIEFRVGINLGDIIVDDGDIHGDGVNIAARLEGLAEPGGICVSGLVHDQVRGRLDCAFDDLGEQNLKNIARAVRVYRVAAASPDPNPPPQAGEGVRRASGGRVGAEPALPLPDKPSIAVLPFQNMSGDPEQDYFVDGMVEEIITALSRIRWLFVIARNSSFTYKGQAIDVKRVGGELGVRYVLEGSVRKAGDRVRITGQLIDTETGAHLWADRFDGSLEDVFDLQDKVASSVAGVIEPALQAAEAGRSSRRPTTDMTAYDLYLRANAMFLASSRLLPQALELVEQAVARDPSFAPALAWAAFCCGRIFVDEGGKREPDRLKGIAFARRALELANDDPNTLATVAHSFGYLGEDIDAAMALVDRALAMNPSYARGWNISGALRLWAGQPEKAIEYCETALRLSPRARIGALLAIIGTGYFLLGRFEDALARLRLAVQEDSAHQGALRVLAACYAHMGRLNEARETMARLRNLTTTIIAGDSYLRNAEQRELFLSGLRLAMGEERRR